jgi:hypothetical protein
MEQGSGGGERIRFDRAFIIMIIVFTLRWETSEKRSGITARSDTWFCDVPPCCP